MSYRAQGRSKARRDENEPTIIAGLRAVGCSVEQLNMIGLPDLLVGYRGQNHLLEVKSATGALTKAQVDFGRRWGGRVAVVRTEREALEAVGAVTPRPATGR